MKTNQTHHDRIDARLEALLDTALAPVAAPAGLNDRILAATTPRLRARARGGVLARLGPALMGLAATLALAVGAATYLAALQQTMNVPPAGRSGLALADAGTSSHRIVPIDAPRGAAIDAQITMLSLQVELADSRELWASPGDSLDDDTLAAELEALINPVMFF